MGALWVQGSEGFKRQNGPEKGPETVRSRRPVPGSQIWKVYSRLRRVTP